MYPFLSEKASICMEKTENKSKQDLRCTSSNDTMPVARYIFVLSQTLYLPDYSLVFLCGFKKLPFHTE